MVENRSMHSRVRITVIYIIVLLLGLSCLLPLLNILAISLSSSAAVSANRVGVLPVDFTLTAYNKILSDGQFWRSFLISVVRVVLCLALNLAVTVPMAYAMTKGKKEFPARNIYMNLLIFAMLFNGGMIPTYILVRNLGLLNSIWSLVLPGALPIFNVILLMNFFPGDSQVSGGGGADGRGKSDSDPAAHHGAVCQTLSGDHIAVQHCGELE